MLAAGGTISFAGQYVPVGQNCTGVNIDPSQSNGVLEVSLSDACGGTLTIQNNKNFWTNYQISGSVTTMPVGASGVYAQFLLLPPNGLFNTRLHLCILVTISKYLWIRRAQPGTETQDG
jgi:hypothetical protein